VSQLRDRGVGVDDIPLDARRAPPPHSDRDIRGTLGSIAAAFELRGAATLATRVYCCVETFNPTSMCAYSTVFTRAVLREPDESNRFVQKSAKTTLI
jgi:hypothetical protein